MPLPELPVLARGETARGERWFLKAGGSAEDYYSLVETVNLFAILLPWTSGITSMQGIDDDGQVLTP
jgi:hypothetical protein